jgi:hypothetical protein
MPATVLAEPGSKEASVKPRCRICGKVRLSRYTAYWHHTGQLKNECKKCDNARKRDWNHANPLKVEFRRLKRRHPGPLTYDEFLRIKQAQTVCETCGEQADLTWDCTDPALGARLGNLQILCRKHNSKKGSRQIPYRHMDVRIPELDLLPKAKEKPQQRHSDPSSAHKDFSKKTTRPLF